MLPEASEHRLLTVTYPCHNLQKPRNLVAVVLAPTAQRKVGIFRCTQPPGLEVILQCQNKHPFHAHPDLPLYTDADDMHVVIQDGLPLDVVDVRLNA